MTRHLTALLAAAVLAAGCGDKRTAATPQPAPPQVAATVTKTTDAKEDASAHEWAYSSVGKRDPFRSHLAEMEVSGQVATRCATPLGRFEIVQLKLVAVVTGLDDPVAMVEAPSGVGYSLKRGACIGRNGGVVSAVRSGEVVISEWAIRADGTRDRTQTLLRLPKEASLNLEE